MILLSTLLPPILGFAVNILPSIVNYYERKQDNEYKLRLTELNLEIKKAGFKHEEISEAVRSVVDEGESLRNHDSTISTNEYVNILRASVRPLLTYFFFIVFVVVKMITMYLMASSGADPFEIMKAVWDDYTVSIFGAVIGFWFGTRSMAYVNETFNKK